MRRALQIVGRRRAHRPCLRSHLASGRATARSSPCTGPTPGPGTADTCARRTRSAVGPRPPPPPSPQVRAAPGRRPLPDQPLLRGGRRLPAPPSPSCPAAPGAHGPPVAGVNSRTAEAFPQPGAPRPDLGVLLDGRRVVPVGAGVETGRRPAGPRPLRAARRTSGALPGRAAAAGPVGRTAGPGAAASPTSGSSLRDDPATDHRKQCGRYLSPGLRVPLPTRCAGREPPSTVARRDLRGWRSVRPGCGRADPAGGRLSVNSSGTDDMAA